MTEWSLVKELKDLALLVDADAAAQAAVVADGDHGREARRSIPPPVDARAAEHEAVRIPGGHPGHLVHDRARRAGEEVRRPRLPRTVEGRSPGASEAPEGGRLAGRPGRLVHHPSALNTDELDTEGLEGPARADDPVDALGEERAPGGQGHAQRAQREPELPGELAVLLGLEKEAAIGPVGVPSHIGLAVGHVPAATELTTLEADSLDQVVVEAPRADLRDVVAPQHHPAVASRRTTAEARVRARRRPRLGERDGRRGAPALGRDRRSGEHPLDPDLAVDDASVFQDVPLVLAHLTARQDNRRLGGAAYPTGLRLLAGRISGDLLAAARQHRHAHHEHGELQLPLFHRCLDAAPCEEKNRIRAMSVLALEQDS